MDGLKDVLFGSTGPRGGRREGMIEAMAKTAGAHRKLRAHTRDRARDAGLAARRRQAAMKRVATPADPAPAPPPRRRFLRHACGAGLALGALGQAHAALLATPAIALGPFYPPRKPADTDADLAQVQGRAGRAQGPLLYVEGRVLDVDGRPLPGGELELWQANAFGRYLHPADTDASGPLDPGFQGYGRLRAGADGRFRIRTIKPRALRRAHAAHPLQRGRGQHPAHHADVLRGRARQRARRPLPVALARGAARVHGALRRTARRPWKTGPSP